MQIIIELSLIELKTFSSNSMFYKIIFFKNKITWDPTAINAQVRSQYITNSEFVSNRLTSYLTSNRLLHKFDLLAGLLY